MSTSQIIVLATPVFFLLIAVEFAWGWARGRNNYQLDDAVNSISLGMLSQLGTVLVRLLQVGIYGAVFLAIDQFRNDAFWTAWYGWIVALLFYDFCYYWKHRAGHECALFWAAHVVHHQSQRYNLSTALRQSGSDALLGWLFYLPMAVAGVPPRVFAIVALVDLLYQFWVHTEHIGPLGWFDRWFCSPSNHRVHHSVNLRYLDRNYGGILIIWDRLFGTFQEEDGPCVYGTRAPLDSWDPLWANADVYWSLAKDSWHARNWFDKLRVWLGHPGWRPADVAQRFPKPAFELAKMQRYAPAIARGNRVVGVLHFVVLLAGVLALLWLADGLPLSASAVWLGVLGVGLWCTGAIMQQRYAVRELLLIECAVLATATGALGLHEWHYLFKPLTLAIAMTLIVLDPRAPQDSRQFKLFLLMALLASLVGDVLLMWPGNYFLAGLASFLIAHVYYLLLLQRSSGSARWFPSRWALAATLLAAAGLYAYLWPGLHDSVLAGAVAVYALVIALMAAQALGRAVVLRSRAATLVGIGALFFMLSDSLLAVNRFIMPLPVAGLWVLGTYYVAQILLARHMLRKP